MKVLFFCNLLPDKLGTFEQFLIALAGHLREQGDSLALAFAGEPSEEVAERLSGVGVSVSVIRGWDDASGRVHPWAFCLPALRILRAEKPDVAAVHFGNELPSLLLIALAAVVGPRGVKWVWHQRQQMADPSGVAARLSRIRLASLGFDHFVACYRGGRRSLRLRGLAPDRTSVIYNALADHRPVRPRGEVRRMLGVPDDAVLVANVGWLVPRKRADVAIEAFVAAAAAGDGVGLAHMVVVGEGPKREALERLVSERGAEGIVHFVGRRRDVRDILAACDVLLHASIAEACANVVLEAMAAGLPVVITEAGAAREQVVEGESGFVVEPDDTTGLGRQLRRLLADRELRARFGQVARQRWEAVFRIETSVREQRACCLGLLNGAKGLPRLPVDRPG